jgi:glycosyltransferase involved in cell wall biosynthesis
VRRLHRFLTEAFPFAWRVVIADSASTDATPAIARALAAGLPDVAVLRLEHAPVPASSPPSGERRAEQRSWPGTAAVAAA